MNEKKLILSYWLEQEETKGQTPSTFQDIFIQGNPRYLNEEEAIKKGLRLYLDREPTVDDAKKCRKVYGNEQDKEYQLIYENDHLGSMHPFLMYGKVFYHFFYARIG